VPVALPANDGSAIVEARAADGAQHLVRLLPAFPGRNVDPTELDGRAIASLGETVARLGRALRGFFHPAAGRVIEWDLKHLLDLREHAALVGDPGRRELLEVVLQRFEERVLPALPGLRAQVIHNDVTLDNLLIDDGRVTGIVDFGDMAHTALVVDIPATLQSLVRDREDIFEVADAFLSGYGRVTRVEADEALLLGDLLTGRMAQTILISVWRTRRYPDNAYITGWEEPAWKLLDQLAAAGFDAAAERLAVAALRPASVPSVVSGAELLERRRRVLGSALSPLTYRRPLHLVRGAGSWMFDADGRGYLDAYNNVPVVGHEHPRVVEAISRQAAILNTNTRYLHEAVVELAERIVATMPPGLDTVMFVNSGSEANDLAWRLATTVTGAGGGIVTDWAYHGVSAAIAAFSPSEWPRGERPEHVETVPPPDAYRGIYRDAAAVGDVAAASMGEAIARMAARGIRPAAVYLDSLFTSDGIFAPSAELFSGLLAPAREAGALLVADEVQAGHGRSGTGLWSFTGWGVIPDIVTLGKPMGNGHPVAAVITRADIVDRFAAETEFFSTFGGNPVACAAALAVLDVIEDEQLIEKAGRRGAWLRDAIGGLATRHGAIGDVRGGGLMAGVELVRDRETREPATALAANVQNAMRESGVLVGTTGRSGSTLKIRPPLAISDDEAGLIVQALDAALEAAGG
jgi:4-aminobutyrate aminotransferase-like enzyme/Ser/Thr protein kinase RdoA (MazF antagonist)